MFKNTAAKFMVFAWDTTTGVAKTGDAANITAYVSKDYGTVTVLADTSATEMDSTNAKGYYLFDAAQGETNGDCLMVSAKSSTANIAVIGAPAVIYTRPTTNWLAPATLNRTLVVDASGLADANTVKVGPTGSGTAQTAKDIGGAVPSAAAGASGGLLISGSNSGTTTFGALTCTGSFTISDGLLVSRSSSNTSAITATGNGTGSGIVATSGSGATGDGIQATAASTNGNGFAHVGTGTGAGFKSTGGATGNGMQIIGGGTSGDAILTSTTSGHGVTFAGTGTTKHGINATGGATTSHGISATGGGVGHGISATSGGGATGDGIRATAVSTNGNALNLIGVGTGAGLLSTAGLTGIGISAVGGGTSGDGIKSVTTSGHGLNLAPVGTNMHGLFTTGGNGGTSDGIKAVAGTGGVPIRGNITGNITGTLDTVTTVTGLTASNLDTTVSSRMATYTQPTGFLAATFPSGTVANTTNITAGTITTVTNLTNAATAGDFTSTMKTSLNAATPTVTTGTISSGVINAASINADTGLIIRANTATASAASTLTLDGSASATADYYKDCWLVITSGTGLGQARRISTYSTGRVATVSPAWATTPASNATFSILPAGRVDVDAFLGTASAGAAGSVGIDWSQVANPTTTLNLSGTTIKTATDIATATTSIQADTDDIQTRLPAALTSDGLMKSDTLRLGGTLQTARDIGASVLLSTGTGTGQLDFTSGVVKANATQFAGQTITAGAGVTIPSTIASPTNITAGTITTVTNLTNAPTAGDFTATMKTSLNSSTPASITGAVGSVTGNVGGSVASVTGNIGGNVVGSVASVTAAVGITSNRKKGATATFEFTMQDSTTGADKTGLTVASVISKDGGSFASTTNAVTEIANGWYQLVLTATEMTANNISLQMTSTGAINRDISLQTQP